MGYVSAKGNQKMALISMGSGVEGRYGAIISHAASNRWESLKRGKWYLSGNFLSDSFVIYGGWWAFCSKIWTRGGISAEYKSVKVILYCCYLCRNQLFTSFPSIWLALGPLSPLIPLDDVSMWVQIRAGHWSGYFIMAYFTLNTVSGSNFFCKNFRPMFLSRLNCILNKYNPMQQDEVQTSVRVLTNKRLLIVIETSSPRALFCSWVTFVLSTVKIKY